MAAQDDDIISPAAIFRSLVRLEAKQDTILSSQDEILVDHKAIKDRLSKVENRQNWFMGALAAMGAGITFVFKVWDKL